jgi:hypothetical protein
MKTLKLLLVAGLALASSLAARAGVSAQAWLETYYLNPQPAELTRNISALSREGYFEKSGHTAIAIGFLSSVFAKNPDQVESWLLELRGLPANHQRLLAAAVWQAGLPLGSDLLRAHAKSSPVRADVEKLASSPSVEVLHTQVHSSSSMNLQWGAFLASGDERYIVNVLDAIGTDRPGVDAAARVALAQNAAAHPRVLDICRTQLDRQPEEVKSVLRAALNAATPAPRS